MTTKPLFKSNIKHIALSANEDLGDALRSINGNTRMVRVKENGNENLRVFIASTDRGKESGRRGWQETGEDATAVIRDNARTGPNVVVAREAEVYGNANLNGKFTITDFAKVGENVESSPNSIVHMSGRSTAKGKAKIKGMLTMRDDSSLGGNVEISGLDDSAENANKDSIGSMITMAGKSYVGGNVKLSGWIELYDNARLVGDLKIHGTGGIIIVEPKGKESYSFHGRKIYGNTLLSDTERKLDPKMEIALGIKGIRRTE